MKYLQKIIEAFRSLTRNILRGEANSFIVGIILLLFAAFSIYHLGYFTNADEIAFIGTSKSTFLSNFLKNNGAIITILAGIPKIFLPDRFNPSILPYCLMAAKLLIVLVNVLLLYLSYFLAKKLFGTKTALLVLVIAGLYPINIGLGQFFHPGAVGWALLIALLLAYLNHIKENSQRTFLLFWLIGGLFFAGAPELFALNLVMVGGIFYFDNNSKPVKKLTNLFLRAGGSLILLLLFSPIYWLKPLTFLKTTVFNWQTAVLLTLLLLFLISYRQFQKFICSYSKILTILLFSILTATILAVLVNSISGFKFFDLPYYLIYNFPRGHESHIGNLLTFAHILVFALPVTVLVFLVLFIKSQNALLNKNEKLFLWLSFLVPAFAFIIESRFPYTQIDFRSILMLASPIVVSSALVLSKIAKTQFKVVLIGTTIIFFAMTWVSKPFYLTYSDVLNTANINTLPSYGVGGYEMAKYISAHYPAKTIISDEPEFVAFFAGKILPSSENQAFPYYRVFKEEGTKKLVLAKVTGDKNKDMALKVVDPYTGSRAQKEVLIGWVFLIFLAFFIPFCFLNKKKVDELLAQAKTFKIKEPGFPFLRIFKEKPVLLEIVLIAIILAIFTAIKLPYLDSNFTGQHSMKYNSYVEPAKYMAQKNDPFWYQKLYLADPVSNPEGISNNFDHFPLTEWGLAITFKLLPKVPIELATRIFTHSLGLAILILLYYFLKKYFPRTQALLITFLTALNPIIIFGTFVTVEDELLVLTSLLSLIFLTKYKEKSSPASLVLCALILGLGMATKISIGLYMLPIVAIILKTDKGWKDFFKDVFFLLVFASFPTVITKLSFSDIGNHTGTIIRLISAIIGIVIISALTIKYWKKLEKVFLNLGYLSYSIIGLVLFILGSLYLYSMRNSSLVTEFLTDKQLIFNLHFYQYILTNQFSGYASFPVLLLCLAGIVFDFLGKPVGKSEQIYKAFLIGSLVYLIVASKAIFIHSYYTMIIMITLAIFASTTLLVLFANARKKLIYLIFVFLLCIWVVADCYIKSINIIREQRPGFQEAAQYLAANTSPDELYVDGDYALSLTLSTTRSAVDTQYFKDNRIKQMVSQVGFKNAMEQLHIKYYVTATMPDYYKVADAFMPPKDNYLPYNRSDLILHTLGQGILDPDTDDKVDIINKEKLVDLFYLEYHIGEYNFYRFKDANEQVANKY